MTHRLFQPSPALADYIKDYQLLVLDFKDQAAVPVKPYPVSPEQGITFYVRGSVIAETGDQRPAKRAQVVIFGQATQRQNLQLSAAFTMFNVLFKPGALIRFLKIPLTDFVHQNVDAELIWGNEIRAVNDRLANAAGYTEMISIVEAFLLNKIACLNPARRPADRIAQLIFDRPQLFDLRRLADEACLSAGRFEKGFIQQMGISPKFYARICRFYQAYQIKQFQPQCSWLEIAWSLGYHDYQHLVRDFKQFSFSTPPSFMEEMARSPDLALGVTPPKGYL